MGNLVLQLSPQETARAVLKTLASTRMRDVLEKRYGIKGGNKRTLEDIGKLYGITRERVRQIETEAFRQLRKGPALDLCRPFVDAVRAYVISLGGAISAPMLLETIDRAQTANGAMFLLELDGRMHFASETATRRAAWAVDKAALDRADTVLAELTDFLQGRHRAVSEEEIAALCRERLTGENFTPSQHTVECVLEMSREIVKNPYREYGLASWPEINPRGVRDKAFVALLKQNSPMHFREVADAINGALWSDRKAHPQTVHNELIKDSRFVLVGRGMYALADWGYEPGVVRDVLVSVMKRNGKPMTKDEIIAEVRKKRIVKHPTILLNLQNKELFRRIDGERYMLV